MLKKLFPLLSILALAVVIAGGGCSDDPSGPEEAPAPPDLPKTPDELIAALENAWNDADSAVQKLDLLLVDDYTYEFFQTDVDTSCIYPTYDRTQELESVGAIYGGSSGRLPLPSGDVRNPIDDIVPPGFLLEETDESPWQPSREEGLEHTLFKRFELKTQVVVTYADTTDTDWMEGVHDFFVTEVESDDGEFLGYRLQHWRDLGFVPEPSKSGPSKHGARKHRFFTWGYFRTIYGDKPDNSTCGG